MGNNGIGQGMNLTGGQCSQVLGASTRVKVKVDKASHALRSVTQVTTLRFSLNHRRDKGTFFSYLGEILQITTLIGFWHDVLQVQQAT